MPARSAGPSPRHPPRSCPPAPRARTGPPGRGAAIRIRHAPSEIQWSRWLEVRRIPGHDPADPLAARGPASDHAAPGAAVAEPGRSRRAGFAGRRGCTRPRGAALHRGMDRRRARTACSECPAVPLEPLGRVAAGEVGAEPGGRTRRDRRGYQGIGARDFSVRREVGTGSWLGRAYQRQRLGTEMRAAVLHLAFAGLGAQHAVSGAYADNAASLAVSRKLGYREDGIERHVVRSEPAVLHRLRLTAERWQQHQPFPVKVEGLTECLPCFGLA
ncbi:GNAT family N-acetyltransferase [Streptomyces spororaveus]|uniref:GNAT family N-acetyltransferase n=1 Tax=Streptomyces spororaveus TaxID=284039 RepID=UPI003694F89F